MAVPFAQYIPSIKQSQLSQQRLDNRFELPQHIQDLIDRPGLFGRATEKSSSAVEVSLPVVPQPSVPLLGGILNSEFEIAYERDHEFKIAYHALADRRGANATPAGRTLSRKVWLDAGADAAKWLIDQLKRERHPETIIGIAETITELEAVALPVALAELERSEAKPEYAALVEALSWMTPPQQPLLMSRIAGIVDRYLASPHIDCQVAAVQLTRILDDEGARAPLDAAKRTAGQRLREEIEDLLNERFDG